MYSRFDYSRCGNLTREALLICLAKCEAGKYGIAFSSGCCAMSAVLQYSPLKLYVKKEIF